jgi:periplasmic protein TonB
MLAYAANAPRNAERPSSPNAMLAIIALHVAAVAVVMSAKMDLPHRILDRPTEVTFVPTPQPPPTNQPVSTPQHQQPTFTQPQQQVRLPPVDIGIVNPSPQPVVDPWSGPSVDPLPRVDPTPAVRIGPKLLTAPAELKPPYPQAKLLAEEEATLKLRLTIDERGRVVAVDPIGRADPAFLEAARRHLIAHWRYKPASEGGRPLSSTEVITLRFQLDG